MVDVDKARGRAEVATLACAVAVAVALGVACGIWINSLLASSAATRRAATPHATSEARAETTPPADKTGTLQGSAVTTGAAPLDGEPASVARVAKPAPATRDAGAQPKPKARLVAAFVSRESNEPEEEEEGRPSSPCALYASAGSLAMRSGGAAFLVVGGPGETGPITVATLSGADIAVAREGAAANGWVRYSVKSISKRPGLYTVSFSTSCGSQTIPVTVK